MRFKTLVVLGFLGFTSVASAQVGTPPITYNGGGGGTGSGGTGCIPSGSVNNILTDNGGGDCISDGAAKVTAGALSLGSSGTIGTVSLGNATSGTLKLQAAAGALGSSVITFPLGTDTVAYLAATQTIINKSISGATNTLSNIATSSLATVQGNGTKVQLSTGTTTTNDCVKFDANGNTVDAGSACGSGASGITIGTTTITSGTNAFVLFNNSGVVGNESLSTLLNTLGSTQGDIAYRNGSVWTVLAPGTAGQLLQSGGASANPSWTTASGAGTTLTAGSGILFSSGSTCTTTCTISTTVNTNAQTGTTYATLPTDGGKIVTLSSASAVAVSLSQANQTGFTVGFGTEYVNLNTGLVTVTAAGGSLFANGLATLALTRGQYALVASDSTGYPITAVTLPVMAVDTVLGNFSGTANFPIAGTLPSCSAGSSALTYNTTTHAWGCNTISGSGTVNSGTTGQLAYYPASAAAVSGTAVGTGVLTAIGNNLSAAGGLTSTIAAGTSAMGTSAIASATCASVVTTSATNATTTDVILAGFNGDPTAVTGYVPTTAGMLTIISYPSANNVNFKVCNNTSSSITPGAITLNWRVVR